MEYKALAMRDVMADLIHSEDAQHLHRQLLPIVQSSSSLADHLQQVKSGTAVLATLCMKKDSPLLHGGCEAIRERTRPLLVSGLLYHRGDYAIPCDCESLD